MNSSVPPAVKEQISALQKYRILFQSRFQKVLDESTPWIKARWGLTAFLAFLYVSRVAYLGGWYIISYALGIYLLNLLIGFLTPQIDPENEFDAALPTGKDDEFRPFIRRLPEFKFWYAFTRAFFVAILCTLTRQLDIPVFWPILLIYFIALFTMTMQKQIKHMIKHKYIPFTLGKPKYAGGAAPKLSK